MDDVKCNYKYCLYGMGLAGMGVCVVDGNWLDPECVKFIEEDEFIESIKINEVEVEQ